MGWFPGYAINTVTGERLNIMFGEDSRYVQHNGRDMIWNPVSVQRDGTQDYVLGGRHYIYVLNAGNQPFHNMRKSTILGNVCRYRTPSYDAGRWANQMLSSVAHLMDSVDSLTGAPHLWHGIISSENSVDPVRDSIAMLYASVAWVNMPLVSPRYAFKYPGRNAVKNAGCASNGIPTDAIIDIDIRAPYGRYMGPNGTSYVNCGQPNRNGNMPTYQFTLSASTYVPSLLNLPPTSLPVPPL